MSIAIFKKPNWFPDRTSFAQVVCGMVTLLVSTVVIFY